MADKTTINADIKRRGLKDASDVAKALLKETIAEVTDACKVHSTDQPHLFFPTGIQYFRGSRCRQDCEFHRELHGKARTGLAQGLDKLRQVRVGQRGMTALVWLTR